MAATKPAIFIGVSIVAEGASKPATPDYELNGSDGVTITNDEGTTLVSDFQEIRDWFDGGINFMCYDDGIASEIEMGSSVPSKQRIWLHGATNAYSIDLDEVYVFGKYDFENVSDGGRIPIAVRAQRRDTSSPISVS